MKILPKAINETLEEEFRRKSKVLDDMYESMLMAQSVQQTPNNLLSSIIKLIEDFNAVSIRER